MRTFDVVIIGGAVHGASLAYHLATMNPGARIALVERDITFATAATALSAGSIRQQFSSQINIDISLAGIAFLRNVSQLLDVNGDSPDISLHEGGYLYLASEAGADTLADNHALQTARGADIRLMGEPELTARFPYLSTTGTVLGSWGARGEGWFDGYRLMQALRNKARSLGVTLLSGEATTISIRDGQAGGIALRDGTQISAGHVAVTAGTETPGLLAHLGIKLPVEARKRCVFSFSCRRELPGFPLLVDPSGVYVRPEGDMFICGVSPPPWNDPRATDFDVDYTLFEEIIWPALADRVPAFEEIRPGRAWAGHYDLNTFDANAIVGPAPDIDNLVIATGFSGHGLQQAPAVGRGLAELITFGRYRALDLSPLAYARIAENKPLIEKNVI